ncbi:MAG: glycerol kinase GlpK [Ruminococcaceae bacterium]|nr:glycerol kinase GlpK [Oscillospiraceae bacterium]
MKKYLLALDQGTTSSRAIIFARGGKIVASVQREFKQYYPHKGWVEHDADEIFDTQLLVAKEAIKKAEIDPNEIAAIGITNQRETSIVWDKATGKPICPAIVWQCRRTAEYCDELKAEGLTDKIRMKTGLVIDAYFSATKIRWILDNVSGARERAERGELLFGTVDAWLIWKLTDGRVHATDVSNAARTMLFNINTLQWDEELLKIFGIPSSMLPTVLPSSGIFGQTDMFGASVPIAGVAGDQQAALFGQCCFSHGDVKNTYGTGGFMLMNTKDKPIFSENGLVTTVAWSLDGKADYALEGSTFVCGAAIQWLRDGLGLIKTAAETEAMALEVPDNGGVYVVPAFVGLGAPYWDAYARGAILGITRGITKNHIVRATLESMAYQTADLLFTMQKDCGAKISSLKVDGGASSNNFLLDFQADILDMPTIRPTCIETTALGAANLAALAVGFYSSLDEISSSWAKDRVFLPSIDADRRSRRIEMWHKAVGRTLNWL